MLGRHPLRLLEEDLGDHGEELGRAGCAVVTDERRLAVARLLLQPVVLLAQHLRPRFVLFAPREQRCTVRMAALLVELVRELVDHHIAPVVVDGGAILRVLPGQHHLPLRPGLARQDLPLFLQNACAVRAHAVNDERARVDEDLPQVRKVVGPAVHDQQAGLGRDRDPHLVGDDEPFAAYKHLLGEEDLDVLPQLDLQVGRQPADIGDAPPENVAPCGRKRPARHPPAPAQDAIGLAREPRGEQQDQNGDDE